MHCLHVLALRLEERLQRPEILQPLSGLDDQVVDPESELSCLQSPLIELQELFEDIFDRDTSYLCITELPDGVIGGVPEEDVAALILVVGLGQVDSLRELDIDVILGNQVLKVDGSDLCLRGLRVEVQL